MKDPYKKQMTMKIDTYEKNLLVSGLRKGFCADCVVKTHKCPVEKLLEKLGEECPLEV